MGEDKFKLGTSSYITIASYQHPFPERVYHLAREALLSGGFLAMDMGDPFVSNFGKKQLYKCHLCVPNLSSLVSLILTIQICRFFGQSKDRFPHISMRIRVSWATPVGSIPMDATTMPTMPLRWWAMVPTIGSV